MLAALISPARSAVLAPGLMAASARSKPYRPHPVTARACVSRVGLALEEPPHTKPGTTFEHGDVYSVKVGIANGTEHAIVSTMVQVREGGTDMIWATW